ncbi:MAG: CBS domain-containing protein [Deltaproteobacteria bacterium]|nr:CBS domain-containing protein [Deltaproteobacteria bacterium]
MPLYDRPVSTIMRREFASLHPDDRLDLAEQMMKVGRVRHLPVLGPDGHVVGIVSSRDLLEASLSSVLDLDPASRRGFLRSVAVADVMRPEVETVAESTSLLGAASRMIRHRIGCLPIVGPDGVMTGLVTETDLLIAAYLPEPAPR